ncbi:MAG: hypothetical protein ACJZ8I_01245 [Paracoccaceae bacterium]
MVFDWLAGAQPIQQRKTENTKKFEYCILQLHHSSGTGIKDIKEANKLGASGWELVSVTTIMSKNDHHDSYYFKRAK